MHETPPLRVSRPVSACARCRSAKIRCDGKLPACTACERAGKAAECSSGNDQFARGKERSYVASLETKIERLERQLQFRRHASNPTITFGRRHSIYDNGHDSKVSKREEASDIDELVSDFGYLAVNATSNGYHGFDIEMSLARLVLSIAVLKELPIAIDFPLPPRVVALDLLQACITNFFTLSPVMSFAAAGGALERVYHHSQRLASPLDIWNVRFMLALGLLSRSKNRGDSEYESAIRHVSFALKTTSAAVIAPGSLLRLQSLTLLVIVATLDPISFDPWYLIGMATRFMGEMGLHSASGFVSGIQSPQAENRRQLFHVVYCLDRFVSMSRLKPFCFSDDSVDLDLPVFLTPNDIRVGQALNTDGPEDFAKDFALLLQCQSIWYYELYFKDTSTIHERWTRRLQIYHDNLAWCQRLSPSMSEPLRSRFMLQIHYIATLLVIPSKDCIRAASSYARAFALERIHDYVEALVSTAGVTEPLGYSRVDDFLRSLHVGERLLGICRNDDSSPFSTCIADVDELGYFAALPELTWTQESSSLTRCIEVINKLDSCLACLNARFDQRVLYRTWKLDAEGVLQTLCRTD